MVLLAPCIDDAKIINISESNNFLMMNLLKKEKNSSIYEN
jgi:hypothetical protein